MKVKFLTCTNDAFSPLFGIEMDLDIQMVAYMKFNVMDVPAEEVFDFRRGVARTSQIVNVKYTETSRMCYEIEVRTNNSAYYFQEGTPSDEIPFTKDEKMAIAMSMMF